MMMYSSDRTRISAPGVERGWWADARWHPKFICIFTRSGFRQPLMDPKGSEIFLEVDAENEKIGEAVKVAVSMSRWLLRKPTPGNVYHVDVQFDPDAMDFIGEQRFEQAWSKRVCKLYKILSKRDLYVPMKRCDIELKNGKFEIRPKLHVPSENEGDCWGFSLPNEINYVDLSANASFEEIGAGLRLAFDRCLDVASVS